MNKQKKILIILCILGMLSTFLPWVTVPIIGSFMGTSDKTGWITFSLFGTALTICLGGNHSDPLNGKYKVGLATAIALATLIGIVEIIDLKNIMPFDKEKDIFGQVITSTFEVGIGLYIEVISGVLALLAAITLFNNFSKNNNPS